MADYNNPVLRGQSATAGVIDQGLRAYMLRVYNYMLVGLVLTGATAWITANTAFGSIFFQETIVNGHPAVGLNILGYVALFAPLVLVLYLSARIQSMSASAAHLTFLAYAALMGISLAPILLVYTGVSIAQVFFITAATFGAMSLWGYTTRANLAGFGSFLFMGLIGIIIASLVNLFLHSAMMAFVVSVIGVLVFTGLTAYDTQNIKEMYVAGDDGTVAGKKAIVGALRLYLDFVNLFLMLLQLLGNRR
ncbi:MAG TPA: Bax inhibitor-1/YccA family protein [Rhizomicrobium sp.]|jgi:FtsH-binding integral membrane protein|nr:Bax inhibitor-1/YccA family protein [Rhizomicrobium sp.]